MDLRLDYNFVRAGKACKVVKDGNVIELLTLTNASVGDRYVQYFDCEGRILLIPEGLRDSKTD